MQYFHEKSAKKDREDNIILFTRDKIIKIEMKNNFNDILLTIDKLNECFQILFPSVIPLNHYSFTSDHYKSSNRNQSNGDIEEEVDDADECE